MALTYKIKNYETDVDDASKTLVGFKVTNEAGGLFLIDKKITTGSNTKNQIVAAAHAAAQTEIQAWVDYEATVGLTFDPDSGTLS
jgi:hypothetical protein|tara:strand:+ start:431 stop:685 length:255 start_codon:yes stop_codon:yes gene_type:complete